jgi:hypothetical protein
MHSHYPRHLDPWNNRRPRLHKLRGHSSFRYHNAFNDKSRRFSGAEGDPIKSPSDSSNNPLAVRTKGRSRALKASSCSSLVMHGRRRKSRVRLRMFFERRTFIPTVMFLLTWAGFAVLALLVTTGKWSHIAHWISRSTPS